MTEAEWLACEDPKLMLRQARFRSSKRKSRLFAVACCRCIWHLLVDDRSRAAVEVAEQYADETATDADLLAAREAARLAHRELLRVLGKVGACIDCAALYAADQNPFSAANNVSWMATTPRAVEVREGQPENPNVAPYLPCTISKAGVQQPNVSTRWKVETVAEWVPTGAEKPVQAGLIRCIFGNPFHPGPLSPIFRVPPVVQLAQSAYDERSMPSGVLDPTRLAILADALEDAGCTDAAILSHLRESGPHVRGCWAVDLILGKK